MTLRLISFGLLGLIGLAPVAVAQKPSPSGSGPATAQAAPTTPATSAPVPAATAPVSGGHSYRPEGRRDPFVSLLRRGAEPTVAGGTKAPGIKGLGAGEVTLRGTIASQGGFVAIVQGADSKTYIVRPGERLADGTIRSITADALVILQQVNDPLSLEKQREVRKVLRQTEEGR